MRLKVLLLLLLTSLASATNDVIDRALEQNIDAALFKDGPLPADFDPASFSDPSHFLESKSLPTLSHHTIDHPKVESQTQASDQPFVNKAIGQLSGRKLDVEGFINDLDRIDCTKYNGDVADPLNVLCDSHLVQSAFAPLGSAHTDTHDFFDYLQNSVYRPLAYNANRRATIPDLVMDSMTLKPKDSLFHGQEVHTNYNKFESSILTLFNNIADKTDSMENNKEAIADEIMNVLKRFHLYWNYLRFNNRFDRLKMDTKEILRTILKSFLVRREFLNNASLTLLTKLTEAYYRFVRAHKVMQLAKIQGPTVMAAHIMRRYVAVSDLIATNSLNNINFVKELAALLNMVQSYHILNARHGMREAGAMAAFEAQVSNQIKQKYNQMVKVCSQSPVSVEVTRLLKHFTAVFLLKSKQLAFIMFQYRGIRQYIDQPSMNYLHSPFAIKVYYEILDNMFLVPKSCSTATILKGCVLGETAKALKMIVDKHKVKRSTYGWFFLDHLTTMLKSLYSGANEQTWQSWPNFKTFYYNALFSSMLELKKTFGINDLGCVADLESIWGAVIEGAKRNNILKPIVYGTLDIFDKEIYNEFLGIKADYNSYAPIEKNPLILSYLKFRIEKFLENFLKVHKSDLGEELMRAVDGLRGSLNTWYHKLTGEQNDGTLTATLAGDLATINVSQLEAAPSLQTPVNEGLVAEEKKVEPVAEQTTIVAVPLDVAEAEAAKEPVNEAVPETTPEVVSETPKQEEAAEATPEAPKEETTEVTPEAPKEEAAVATPEAPKEEAGEVAAETPKEEAATETPKEEATEVTPEPVAEPEVPPEPEPAPAAGGESSTPPADTPTPEAEAEPALETPTPEAQQASEETPPAEGQPAGGETPDPNATNEENKPEEAVAERRSLKLSTTKDPTHRFVKQNKFRGRF